VAAGLAECEDRPLHFGSELVMKPLPEEAVLRYDPHVFFGCATLFEGDRGPSHLLLRIAQKYWQARRAQEQDPSDATLDFLRSEAHDLLLRQMRIEGIKFEDREDAAQIALGWGV